MQIIETRNKASPPFPDPAQDQLEKLLFWAVTESE